ncbi:hypothetical protein E2320_013555, partial [Naja naja]
WEKPPPPLSQSAAALTFFLSVHPSIHPSKRSVCLPACLPAYLSTYLSVFLSVYLPTYLSTNIDLSLSLSLPIYLTPSPSYRPPSVPSPPHRPFSFHRPPEKQNRPLGGNIAHVKSHCSRSPTFLFPPCGPQSSSQSLLCSNSSSLSIQQSTERHDRNGTFLTPWLNLSHRPRPSDHV